MRKFRKRLQKKYFKKVAIGQQTGTLIPFYARRAIRAIQWYFDYKYLTEFRPWWYDHFDDWGTMQLGVEHRRFVEKWDAELEQKWGIDLKNLEAFHKAHLKRQPRNRKPRKEKVVPIRKLKKPEIYKITMYNGQEKIVEGEKVFTHEGYDFFIRHDGLSWVVSDVAVGASLSHSDRYKKAVEVARKRVTDKFDSYVKQVNERLKIDA